MLAHAMGRTLVIPPQQHLYLLGKVHKDKNDKEAHDEVHQMTLLLHIIYNDAAYDYCVDGISRFFRFGLTS